MRLNLVIQRSPFVVLIKISKEILYTVQQSRVLGKFICCAHFIHVGICLRPLYVIGDKRIRLSVRLFDLKDSPQLDLYSKKGGGGIDRRVRAVCNWANLLWYLSIYEDSIAPLPPAIKFLICISQLEPLQLKKNNGCVFFQLCIIKQTTAVQRNGQKIKSVVIRRSLILSLYHHFIRRGIFTSWRK